MAIAIGDAGAVLANGRRVGRLRRHARYFPANQSQIAPFGRMVTMRLNMETQSPRKKRRTCLLAPQREPRAYSEPSHRLPDLLTGGVSSRAVHALATLVR